MKKIIFLFCLYSINQIYAQIPNYVPANGLVAYFPFNGNANDVSGNAHNGIINGNVTLTTDHFGNLNSSYKWQSSNFNSNDYINIGYLYNDVTNKITISTWVLLDCSQPDQRIISSGEQGLICYQVQGDLIQLKVSYDSAGGIWPSNQFINKTIWHHIVFTADATTGISKFYIDGLLTDTIAGTGGGTLSTDIWNIGRKSISAYDGFCGKIDEIGIWNRALTQEEITSLYYNFNCLTVAPIGNSNQTLCANSILTDLQVTGTNIQYYDAQTGGNLLQNTTTLTNGQMVYATQTLNGCESVDRLAITVTINSTNIVSSATNICIGTPITLTASTNLFNINSCTGTSAVNFMDFTLFTPVGNYSNIIKNNNYYYLRSESDVLKSTNLVGPYLSLNFNNQIGINGATELLGLDNLNRLHIATNHNGLFIYDGTNWSSEGLIGYGTTGQFFTKLDNGRIVITKSGYLRGIYYSDDNGTNWVKATNMDVDWNNIIVASNGNLYASSGAGGVNDKGVIISTDNGSSWSYLNTVLGITSSTGLFKDCNNNLYIVGDNKLFKSSDNGNIWNIIANTPAIYSSFPGYGEFVVASNGDFYYYGGSHLFYSSNQGNVWTEINSSPGNYRTIREIDGNIIVCTTQGAFAKTLNNNVIYHWSTGETTASINPTPTTTTTYWCDVTVNGTTCHKEITVIINSLPSVPFGLAIQSYNTGATIANLIVIGANLNWYSTATSSTTISTSILLVNGTTYYVSQTVNGCEGPRLAITVNLGLGVNQNELLMIAFNPNPVKDFVTIKSNQILKQISVYNVLGQLLINQLKNSSEFNMDLTILPSGNYFIKAEAENKEQVFKIIKQ